MAHSPFRALAALERRPHFSPFPVCRLQPRVSWISNACVWTASAPSYAWFSY
jgi:hypothetical protein